MGHKLIVPIFALAWFSEMELNISLVESSRSKLNPRILSLYYNKTFSVD